MGVCRRHSEGSERSRESLAIVHRRPPTMTTQAEQPEIPHSIRAAFGLRTNVVNLSLPGAGDDAPAQLADPLVTGDDSEAGHLPCLCAIAPLGRRRTLRVGLPAASPWRLKGFHSPGHGIAS